MANKIATLLKNNLTIFNPLLLTRATTSIVKGNRYLYSQTTLGLDTYLHQKDSVKNQLFNIIPKFKEKMNECTKEESKNMVFTEDLKNMLHLVDNDDDVNLVIKMMKRFNQQNKQLRFGNFIFGPVIMRMFHVLNKPQEAYECFKSPELDGLFDQLITYQILLDLLYENQRYNDVLEACNIIQEKQIEGIKFAKNVIVLTLAACYKLNTKESLEYALNLWTKLRDIGHLPMRRAVTYCAALALNQGHAEIAIEILSASRNSNYTTIRNIKAAALLHLGKIDDVILLLKSILHEDSASLGPVPTFNKDIVENIKAAIEKSDNKEVKLEFNKIEKYYQEQGHISKLTLDEQLCREIASPPAIRGKNNAMFSRTNYYRSQENTRSNRFENKHDFVQRRPGLADL